MNRTQALSIIVAGVLGGMVGAAIVLTATLPSLSASVRCASNTALDASKAASMATEHLVGHSADNMKEFDALARRLAQLQVRLEAAESNWLDCANATISTAATVDALRLSLARPSTAARR